MAYTSAQADNGSTDANGFYMRFLWEDTPNAATNTTTIRCSYILHEGGNNFSQYSCTTYFRYKIGTAAYVDLYRPSTTIQYSAMTTNSYYWIGNNTLYLAGSTAPYTVPSSAYDWTFTINHNADGTVPTTVLNGYFDSNTNATYVPVGTTNTFDITSTVAAITPYFTVGCPTPTVTRPTANTIRVSVAGGATTNTAANNAITYTYSLYVNGSFATSTTGGEGASVTFSDVTISADSRPSIYVIVSSSTATSTSSTIYSDGYPSIATGLSATESSPQSRNVTIQWTPGAANNTSNTLSSQTLEWSTGMSDATFSAGYVGGVTLNGTASSYTITPDSAPTAGTSVLLPSTKYSYRITATNTVGSNGTSIVDPTTTFTTRASSPFISPSANTVPNTRSSTKVWNGTSMVQAKVMVYDGTTPYNANGWKYLK